MANQKESKRYWQDVVTVCTLAGSVALIGIILMFNESSNARRVSRTSNSSQQISAQHRSNSNISSQNNSSNSPSVSPLTQSQAVEIVTRWLSAKPKIFGPPFDKNLLSQLTTGNAYQDKLGSIDWLQNNGYRYSYAVSRVDEVWSFVTSNTSPSIKVSIYEDLTLYTPYGIDRSKSGASKMNFIYYFARDTDGQWKIENHRTEE